MCNLVTVALLTYNRAEYLKESLAAVISQTYDDLEILVCDNASSDATSDVIQAFNDPRVVHIRQSINKGVDGNYREAVKRAAGDFVLITHDDDVMEPTLIERQVSVMKHDRLCLGVASNVSIIDANGRVLQERWLPFKTDQLFKKGDYLKAWVQSQLTLPITTFMYRTVKFKKGGASFINLDDPPNDLGVYGDVFSMCRTNLEGRLYLISDPLLKYRQHGQQDSFADDIVQGGIRLHKRLISLCKKRMPELSKVAEGCLLRYRALGEIVTSTSPLYEPNGLVEAVATLDSEWRKIELAASDRILSSLSFALLKAYLGIEDPDASRFKGVRNLQTTDDFLSAWLYLRKRRNFYVCEHLDMPGKARVSVLGSVFNAYLLGLDCVQAGHEVVAFLDSNKCRQGQTMGDVPVQPPAWLHENASEIDVIIISSERDRVAGLSAFLEQFLPVDWQGKIVGWREAVKTAIGVTSVT